MIADAKEKKLQEELAFKRDGFLFKTTIFIAGIPLAIYFSSYGGELGRTTWDAIFNGAICGLFIAVAVVVLRLMWRGFTRA
jgi:hypothetical protein